MMPNKMVGMVADESTIYDFNRQLERKGLFE
jgi:hypothetical protein